MNKHGQTLVLFVVLIPILLGFTAFIIDMGLIISKTVELKEVSKTILENVKNNASDEKIRELFLKNDIPVEQLDVVIEKNQIHIFNEYEVDSIFGAVIGIKDYDIRVDITGIYNGDKVTFE